MRPARLIPPMRRFERTTDGLTRTWSVDLRGRDLHITSGPPGRERTRVQSLRTPSVAASALATAIGTMVEAGWTECVPEAPEVGEPGDLDWIARNPEDPAPYLVLGDSLHEEDPVRSALIAVQGAMLDAEGERLEELTAEQQRLLDQHGPELLGSLQEFDAKLQWFCGFISGLTLEGEGRWPGQIWRDTGSAVGPQSAQLADQLDGLCAGGLLPLLQRLTIRAVDLDPFPYTFVRHRWPALRSLTLASGAAGLTAPAHSMIQTMPQLKRLSIQGSLTGLCFAHGELEHLELLTQVPEFPGLDGADLPKLTSLSLGNQEALGPATLRALVRRPLARLQLSGSLPQVYLEGLKRGRRPDLLVLRAPDNATHLAATLLLVAKRLKGVRIVVEESDLLDAEIEDLQQVLDIEVTLPERAFVHRGAQLAPQQEQERRLEKVRLGTRRFWCIVREGSRIVLRWGVHGSDGQTLSKQFASEERAAVDYRRRLRRKVAEGWHVA